MLSNFCAFLLFFSIINAQNSINTDDCGINYGCLKVPSDCQDKSCDYVIKWRDNLTTTELIMGTRALVSNFYMAIGFSYDRKMGDDCVVMCKYITNDSPSIEHYYNPSDVRTSEVLDPNNPKIGLYDMDVSLNDNYLICKLRREKAIPNKSKYFDLNKMYYLLVVKGYLDPENEPTDHKKNKLSSPDKIDFTSVNGLNTSLINFNLTKAHGMIMVSTWLFIATFGILFSRYYKDFNPNSLYFGVQPWFFFHRSLMIMTPILSIIGFCAIFYANDWNWVSLSLSKNFVHSIIGIIAVGLSILQPIFALFRPDKDAPNRPVFNWIHRITGLLAYFLALTAILFGSLIFFNDLKWIVITGWFGWLIIVVLFLEIINLKIRKDREEVPLIQHSDDEDEIIVRNSCFNERFKLLLVLIHLIISIILVISMNFFIAIES